MKNLFFLLPILLCNSFIYTMQELPHEVLSNPSNETAATIVKIIQIRREKRELLDSDDHSEINLQKIKDFNNQLEGLKQKLTD